MLELTENFSLGGPLKTTLIFVATILLTTSSFGYEYKRVEIPRSLFCERVAADGKPIVYGLHNPYRMRGYVISELPLDKQHNDIFERYILPAMDAACKASNGNGATVINAGLDSCLQGCHETKNDYNLRLLTQKDTLNSLCYKHCMEGTTELMGVAKGYELSKQ
jgi:hypothetical protein